MTTDDDDDAAEIWRAICDANAAWMRGEPRAVAGLFADDAVMVAPGFPQLVGRDAIVASFVEYCAQVRTHAFRELEHTVDVRGQTAVATYRYAVRYELASAVHDELGQEVLVFARHDGRWQAIWRTQIPLGAPPAAT